MSHYIILLTKLPLRHSLASLILDGLLSCAGMSLLPCSLNANTRIIVPSTPVNMVHLVVANYPQNSGIWLDQFGSIETLFFIKHLQFMNSVDELPCVFLLLPNSTLDMEIFPCHIHPYLIPPCLPCLTNPSSICGNGLWPSDQEENHAISLWTLLTTSLLTWPFESG